jgi:hypothetical protein
MSYFYNVQLNSPFVLETKMQRHHELELMQLLDTLYEDGAASVLEDHCYLWFNKERLNLNTVYREITTRWKETCEYYGHGNDVPKLKVLNTGASKIRLFRDLFEGEEWTPLNNDK